MYFKNFLLEIIDFLGINFIFLRKVKALVLLDFVVIRK